MADKEFNNISEIQSYLEGKKVTNTGAYSIWKASVTYVCKPLQTKVIPDTEVRYQYSNQPAIIIPALQPPYYSEFRPEFQDFKFENDTLIIRGTSKEGWPYKVTIK